MTSTTNNLLDKLQLAAQICLIWAKGFVQLKVFSVRI
jgi:hypothetical protein